MRSVCWHTWPILAFSNISPFNNVGHIWVITELPRVLQICVRFFGTPCATMRFIRMFTRICATNEVSHSVSCSTSKQYQKRSLLKFFDDHFHSFTSKVIEVFTTNISCYFRLRIWPVHFGAGTHWSFTDFAESLLLTSKFEWINLGIIRDGFLTLHESIEIQRIPASSCIRTVSWISIDFYRFLSSLLSQGCWKLPSDLGIQAVTSWISPCRSLTTCDHVRGERKIQ